MKMILTGFSEEINLENPKAVNFLVFDCGGEVLRVPVGSETIQAVAAHYYKFASKETVEPVVTQVELVEEEQEEPREEQEEEFEDEDFEDEDNDEGNGLRAVTLAPPSGIPKSEAEVPSL